ncbi:polysaccharide biosynthesis protein [Sulfitobacter indolifex]|uniref:polysaccharide biosynthesis protein n=1 Tax=Sulfitobacter indolifex TaxID=225422 RepID=UPI0010525123|nr:nucleoside-diphosphate sugar epimerase/dehydratase [Sulfitobacter indolifex]
MLNLIKSLTRRHKRNVMLAVDSMSVILAAIIVFMLLEFPGGFLMALGGYVPILPYLVIVTAICSIWLGVCTVSLNAFDKTAVGITAALALVLSVTSWIATGLSRLDLPIGLHVMLGVIFFALVVISRAAMLRAVLAIYRHSAASCRVLIYGAGTTGTQLVSALRSHETIEPIAFIDDNAALQGLRVAHLQVHSSVKLKALVQEKQIDRVLLAMPSLSVPKQAQIARQIEKMGLEVQALPSFAQLVGEEALVEQLTPLSPHRFLNRDEVSRGIGDAAACYKDKVVFISGAGGSIGSELCRQILECRPSKLILFELSELALYTIHMELGQLVEGSGIEVVPILGSVTDARQMQRVLTGHDVNVVLHAAAYKHVSLVETNPLAGLVNNVLGTQTLAEQSVKVGVERFILISSDKAVRPTNVMGGSKRLAELVIQNMARKNTGTRNTIFSMVRFGNVLGSSGSVVPLFQEQLSRGGPLTVTDRSVNRYFMTIQEAVRLVLQAGAFAQGGEVFVLDMGKPVSILQLARQVVEASGYTVRDDATPDGDIMIEIIGLRPGEKMTEELTLCNELIGTTHPKIFSAREGGLKEFEVAAALRDLREALIASDEDKARGVVGRWVESPLPTQVTQ